MAKEYGRALIHHSSAANGRAEVSVKKSKAGAAGENGASFHAPGWRAMAFKSPHAAVAKLEKHEGFKGWIGGKPDLPPVDEPEVATKKKMPRDT